VGVWSPILYLLGAWGISRFNFGKSVSQASNPKEMIHMVSYNSFGRSMFCMENNKRAEKKIIEIEKPQRGDSRAYLEQKNEESGSQDWRLNSCVSFIITTSVCCCLLVVFLAVRSLEFPIEIFLVTCARETVINEWDVWWTKRSEGVHSLGWAGQEEESYRNSG